MFSTFASYRNQNADAAKAYEDAKSDEDRRVVLAKFVIDSNQGKCMGKTSTSVSTSKAEKGVGQWLTEEQLAGPLYFNSTTHAKIRCKSLPSQDHEDADLAKEGVLQYWHVGKTVETQKKGEAGIRSHLQCRDD